jgi:His-Xaa-Ser system radical SAM maturase HxsB
MPKDIKEDEVKLDKNLGFFRFKKMKDGNYLITSESGKFAFLSNEEFSKFLNGKIDVDSDIIKELSEKYFMKSGSDSKEHIAEYTEKNQFLFQKGPSLHIIVATLRCNHNCVYCQASSCGLDEKNKDLDIETARKIVDFIFKSPNESLTIEFQGGEPLLNWPVVKFIAGYARKKSKQEKRNVRIALVSNFSLLDEEKAEYLLKNKVTFCTSLDGPEKLHNKNRIWAKGNSHRAAAKWAKYLLARYKNYYVFQPGALTTITKFSLPYWKEIVDEYVKFGFDNIILRPLAQIGVAQKGWQKIGYSPDEFLEFYKKSLDYIFFLNLEKGEKFRELTATYFAVKIFLGTDPNFFDLRSPCGAGIGQILYNYNGDIYTCDEGRMMGDDMCKIGKVGDSYEDLLTHPATKSLCLASCLESLPCDNCVYKPYCGTCPILNYAESGNIFPQLPNSSRCRINQGILDYLFSKIKENDKIKALLSDWAAGGMLILNERNEKCVLCK